MMAAATYLTYEELSTLGRIGDDTLFAKITRKPNGVLAVLGSISGFTNVPPGGRIGYAEGRVWAASSLQHRDPIRAFLAGICLPQGAVHLHDDVEYCPNTHERFVAGMFSEEEGEHGMRIIVGGDAIVIIERGDLSPPYLESLVVRSHNEDERRDLIPWIREAMLTKLYVQTQGQRMDAAYYMARSICIASGIRWDSKAIFLEGKTFKDGDAVYAIHAYRDLGSEARKDQCWIPHIREVRSDYDVHLSIAESLESGLLRRWVTALNASQICNVCYENTLYRKGNYYHCSNECF